MASATDRKTMLQNEISKIAGCNVEITIRGDRKFTFSTDRVDQDLEFHLTSYFGKAMVLDGESAIDDCGTFVYMRAA